jgi:hypothetical protein
MAGVLALLMGAASAPSVPQDAEGAPPGEGVICTMAIFGAIAEIGRRCYPDRLPEFQAELRQSLVRLDAYVLANSDMTAEDLERFKADQSGAGLSDAELCSSEFGSVYTEPQATEAMDADDLRSSIDQLVARPGTPTWGTCV